MENKVREQAAVCGLFCPSCTLYIGTQEEPERLKAIAARRQCEVEELKCDGCRAERRSFWCRKCTFVSCAAGRGIEFCGDCPEYPCGELKAFQAAMPHRIELWQSQERIREAGCETWFTEMAGHYSCPECGAVNSAYDLSCRKCGADPGSEYVRLHREEIEGYLKK